MKLQKSRRIRRKQSKRQQTKRKQKHTMRKQSKRRRYSKRRTYKSKKYYGGKFNDVDTDTLVQRMREKEYTEEEITSIMNDLHQGAHYFSGPVLPQLLFNFDRMNNKEQFKKWVKDNYNPVASDDETDWEDSDDDED
jgi:hypothetical protein